MNGFCIASGPWATCCICCAIAVGFNWLYIVTFFGAAVAYVQPPPKTHRFLAAWLMEGPVYGLVSSAAGKAVVLAVFVGLLGGGVLSFAQIKKEAGFEPIFDPGTSQLMRLQYGAQAGLQPAPTAHCLPRDPAQLSALVRVALDVSGRPFLDYKAPENVPHIGDKFNFTLVEEFLRAFAFKALINLHVAILYGRDPHHMAEATFKGLARSFDDATQIDKRIADVIPSTKDVL